MNLPNKKNRRAKMFMYTVNENLLAIGEGMLELDLPTRKKNIGRIKRFIYIQ